MKWELSPVHNTSCLLLLMGLMSFHKAWAWMSSSPRLQLSSRPLHLLWHEVPPWPAWWIFPPTLASMGCRRTVVFTVGCQGISAPEEPLLSFYSLTFVSASLSFYSHLSYRCCTVFFTFPIYTEVPPSLTWSWLQLGSVQHGVSSHRGHPCSSSAIKTLQHKPNTTSLITSSEKFQYSTLLLSISQL